MFNMEVKVDPSSGRSADTYAQRYGTGIYQMRCTAYKVAPDDGLIQSETCTASNEK